LGRNLTTGFSRRKTFTLWLIPFLKREAQIQSLFRDFAEVHAFETPSLVSVCQCCRVEKKPSCLFETGLCFFDSNGRRWRFLSRCEPRHKNPQNPEKIQKNPQESSKVHKNPQKSTKIRKNPQKSAKIRQNPQKTAKITKSAKIHQNPQKSRKNPPKSAKIHQNPQKSAKIQIHQNPQKSAKIRQKNRKNLQKSAKNPEKSTKIQQKEGGSDEDAEMVRPFAHFCLLIPPNRFQLITCRAIDFSGVTVDKFVEFVLSKGVVRFFFSSPSRFLLESAKEAGDEPHGGRKLPCGGRGNPEPCGDSRPRRFIFCSGGATSESRPGFGGDFDQVQESPFLKLLDFKFS